MEDSLYDTSWLVHSIPRLTSSLSRLLFAPSATPQARDEHRDRLLLHADSFSLSLGKDRLRYEREEEKEQLGGLRQCSWTRLEITLNDDKENQSHTTQAGKKRKRERREERDEQAQSTGICITLVYEKKTYKFIIYTTLPNTTTSKRSRVATATSTGARSTNSTNEGALLLSKSSPAALKALTTYLSDTFALDQIQPLKLPTALLQTTLEKYLITTSTSLLPSSDHDEDNLAGEEELGYKLFKSLSGTIKLTISFSAPVAPSLKSLEIGLPPETVLEMCRRNQLDEKRRRKLSSTNSASTRISFTDQLASYIAARTGLSIPILRGTDTTTDMARGPREGRHDDVEQEDQEKHDQSHSAMKFTRISTASYAISVDSRLKFVSKAVDAVGDDRDADGKGNCVRRANRDVLNAVLSEAKIQASSGDG